MSYFELRLNFSPAFHRSCRVVVAGDETGEARVEADAIGLLPRLERCVPVDAEALAKLRGACRVALSARDPSWKEMGLDGIGVSGTFESTESDAERFEFWSPAPGSIPQVLLAAALECLPAEQFNGLAGELLENVRGYLHLPPALVWFPEDPPRVRITPYLCTLRAHEVERHLKDLPEATSLVVDMRTDPDVPFTPHLGPFKALLRRYPSVRWLIADSPRTREVLEDFGVPSECIEVEVRPAISRSGQFMLLRGTMPVHEEVLAIARHGTRKDLLVALRNRHGLPLDLAAKAAAELKEFVSSPAAND